MNDKAIAALNVVKGIIVDTVRESGGSPSGMVFTVFSSMGVSLATYSAIIDQLVKENRIKLSNHYLSIP